MAKGRKTGGRKKGTPNKATAELQDAARQYTPVALKTLREICAKGESEAARVAAANSLLDRGHGKPTTCVVGDLTHREAMPVYSEPISATAAWIEELLADSSDSGVGKRNGKSRHDG